MASLRDKVEAESDGLYEYLAFRHFLVHAYAFGLDETRLMPLASNLPNVCARFMSEIDSAVEAVEPHE
jgi:hypothetical protein